MARVAGAWDFLGTREMKETTEMEETIGTRETRETTTKSAIIFLCCSCVSVVSVVSNFPASLRPCGLCVSPLSSPLITPITGGVMVL